MFYPFSERYPTKYVNLQIHLEHLCDIAYFVTKINDTAVVTYFQYSLFEFHVMMFQIYYMLS